MRERRDHPVRESKCAIRLHAAEIHSTPDGQFARFDEHPLRRLRERAAHAVLLHHAACRVARTRVVAVRRQHDAVRQTPRRLRGRECSRTASFPVGLVRHLRLRTELRRGHLPPRTRRMGVLVHENCDRMRGVLLLHAVRREARMDGIEGADQTRPSRRSSTPPARRRWACPSCSPASRGRYAAHRPLPR